MCPHCGQNAPVVYRGVVAHCTACGAPRPPLTGSSLHLAGQPSRIGGVVARVLGWVVLGVGLSIALGVGAIAQMLFPSGIAGFLIGIPLAALSLLLGVFLLRGGARLDRSATSAERGARSQAIHALATHKGGTLTAADVTRALDVPPQAAEALLESLAREEADQITVDIDANGALSYRFAGAGRVRVDPEIAGSPNRAEWERLEAEESAAAQARERARAPR
jgi:hypothetical protein